MAEQVKKCFFKCFYIEKRVEVYKLIYHGIFRLWCVASLKIFFIRIEFKKLQKKKPLRHWAEIIFCLRQQGTWNFIKHFWSWSKYISTATVTHVKRHYSETDWKMSKLRLCQLKLGFFNQFPALYLSENNFN